MKRFMSMFLCLMMVFTLAASFSTCFASIADINVGFNDDSSGATTKPATITIGKYGSDGKVQDTNKDEFNWNKIFIEYKNVITGVSGVAALTFLVFFMINFMKLGGSSGNPQQRSQALMGIVWCGIACAGLGGIAIFFGFFYNMLSK